MPNSGQLTLKTEVLDELMPMHLRLDRALTILQAGPSFQKLLGGRNVVGKHVFDLLTVIRPASVAKTGELRNLGQSKLILVPCDGPSSRLRAHVVELEYGYLLNIAPGPGVVRLLEDRVLSERDFSPTDPSMDFMYMLEVQNAVLKGTRRLTNRLNYQRLSAESQAMTDSLTGLANRRAVTHLFERVSSRKLAMQLGLVSIDLDHFKSINDTYGHPAGDFVLRKVADIFLNVTRPMDLVSRLGGDEFLLILKDVHDHAGIASVCSRVMEKINEPIRFGDTMIKVGASIGASLANTATATSTEDVMNTVDRALYAAKKGGRGRVEIVSKSPVDVKRQAAGHTESRNVVPTPRLERGTSRSTI